MEAGALGIMSMRSSFWQAKEGINHIQEMNVIFIQHNEYEKFFLASQGVYQPHLGNEYDIYSVK
ncbi:hypothetical protein MUK42_34358 [Musa troglodytarum]|uniref:Uncharacterized protein n=1 Tax=Musa troglodytarum TaxID=320322 RepID=A0A9E7HLG6_9LILI|nr:hypothetical protein MUK42_34358 [Musa troglodytarum]